MKCDKQEFVLSEKEIEVLKQASAQGNRGLVWFKGFAISIAHIQSITKQKKPLETWNPAYTGMAVDPEGLKRIAEMKKQHSLWSSPNANAY